MKKQQPQFRAHLELWQDGEIVDTAQYLIYAASQEAANRKAIRYEKERLASLTYDTHLIGATVRVAK